LSGYHYNYMKDKVIIITGASSGIGKALAIECSSRGANVVLAARRTDPLNELSGSLKTETLIVRTDVSVEPDCKNLVSQTISKFGRIDVLINNAGISMRALFDEVDLDVIRRLFDTNFWGTVYCSKYALPYLLESKGSLVAVSSVAGFVGLPGRTGYSASKSAIHGLLGVIRTENMKKGLHVLLACPGFTSSNIRNLALSRDGKPQGETPLDESKLMPAEEVAKHICNAIQQRKRTVILTTQGKMTVLLNKFFPSFMDKLVYNHMSKEPNSPFT
jgi:dehydrogenase/reductase SDR family member 7B